MLSLEAKEFRHSLLKIDLKTTFLSSQDDKSKLEKRDNLMQISDDGDGCVVEVSKHSVAMERRHVGD